MVRFLWTNHPPKYWLIKIWLWQRIWRKPPFLLCQKLGVDPLALTEFYMKEKGASRFKIRKSLVIMLELVFVHSLSGASNTFFILVSVAAMISWWYSTFVSDRYPIPVTFLLPSDSVCEMLALSWFLQSLCHPQYTDGLSLCAPIWPGYLWEQYGSADGPVFTMFPAGIVLSLQSMFSTSKFIPLAVIFLMTTHPSHCFQSQSDWYSL